MPQQHRIYPTSRRVASRRVASRRPKFSRPARHTVLRKHINFPSSVDRPMGPETLQLTMGLEYFAWTLRPVASLATLTRPPLTELPPFASSPVIIHDDEVSNFL